MMIASRGKSSRRLLGSTVGLFKRALSIYVDGLDAHRRDVARQLHTPIDAKAQRRGYC